jgi:hypothetical protein
VALFNSYNDVQLQVGSLLDNEQYLTDDPVDIDDGVYIGYEGVVCVANGKLIKKLPLKDKWNRNLSTQEVLGRKAKLDTAACYLIEESFGLETLEFIIRDCAPDLEFIGKTLEELDSYLTRNRIMTLDLWTFQRVENSSGAFNMDNSNGTTNRVYTNPVTDNSFQISFKKI